MNRTHGEVCDIEQHPDGQHAVLTLRHGPRKPAPKGKGGKSPGLIASSEYDDRPSSRVHIPIAQATKVKLGQQGSIRFTPHHKAKGAPRAKLHTPTKGSRKGIIASAVSTHDADADD